nr:hypothetical protein GCM10017745_46950 [Saccharothrix mutabilis subsp. capreolus]
MWAGWGLPAGCPAAAGWADGRLGRGLGRRTRVGGDAVPEGRVEFGVLGPVVTWHEGREHTIASGRQRCVLALLVLEAGRVVSLDRLVDALWEAGSAPRTARNVVQQCVSELRKLVAVDPGARLVLKAPGYALEVDPQRVDLHRFRSLVAAARAEDPAVGRAAGLRRALALWRGEPLAGADAPGLVPARQALAEERLAVLEECLTAEVESGRHAEAVPELTALVAEHPLRERPAELLMLALYRGGRASEALEHYHHTRQRLAEQLGTDPGPALRELHQRVLTADPALTLPTRDTPPPAATPRQLPAPPAPFTGRRDELDRLDTALHASNQGATVTISALAGAGGIGKTWLALHWAHRHTDRFPDGQMFVDLRGFSPTGDPTDPAVAVRGFLDALGVEPAASPPTSTPKPRSTAAWSRASGCSSCWTTPPPATRSSPCYPAHQPAPSWSPAAASWPR